MNIDFSYARLLGAEFAAHGTPSERDISGPMGPEDPIPEDEYLIIYHYYGNEFIDEAVQAYRDGFNDALRKY